MEQEDNRMRIYISGPITNNPNFKEDFGNAAEVIAERGHEYINPAKNAEVIPDAQHCQYMTLCYQMLPWADAITFLPGWEDSKGAQEEYQWAKALGLFLYDLETDRFADIDD